MAALYGTNDYKVLVKMTKSTIDGSAVQNYNSTSDGYIDTGLTAPSGMSGTYFVDVANSKYGFGIPAALTKYKGDTGTATGSASTYYCDAGWSGGGLCALLSSGSVGGELASGLFCFYVNNAPSNASWNIGASLPLRVCFNANAFPHAEGWENQAAKAWVSKGNHNIHEAIKTDAHSK